MHRLEKSFRMHDIFFIEYILPSKIKIKLVNAEKKRIQDRSIDFNVIEYKSSLKEFYNLHYNYHLRKYHLLSFGVVSKKNTHN